MLQKLTAAYLDAHHIAFDRRYFGSASSEEPMQLTAEEFESTPFRVYFRLAATQPEAHGIERLLEHVWRTEASEGEMWEELAWHTVFTYLFNEFLEQFGWLSRSGVTRLKPSILVAQQLFWGDRIINLNYDTSFDVALQQAGKYFCYSPDQWPDAIRVHKPHGSFNFFAHVPSGDCFFCDPSEIVGSVSIRDPRDKAGRIWSPAAAIVPPRFGKSYSQHPAARLILDDVAGFAPEVVTFWGIGLTDSDTDLLEVYRNVITNATLVQFINPDSTAVQSAQTQLNTTIQHFLSVDAWLATLK